MGQMRGFLRKGVFVAAGALLWSTAHAQTASQTLTETVPEQKSAEHAPLPDQTAPPDKPMQEMGDPGRSVMLNSMSVSGSTVFSEADFSPLYADMVGKEVTVGQLNGVAQSIRNMYRDAGYVFTRTILNMEQPGAAQVVVVEATIGQVTLEEPAGSIGSVKNLLEGMAQRLAGHQNPRLADLERTLLLMNDVPGITRATAVPRPGQSTGEVDLFINVERDAFSGAVFADNRQSPVMGRGSAGVQVNIDSYTSGADSTQFTFVNSFGTEFDDLEERHLGQIAHQRHFGSSGLVGKARLLYGRTRPGDVLEPLDLEGNQLEAEVQLEYPVKRTRRLSIWVNGGFEYRNVENEVLGGVATLSDDRLRVVTLGARMLQRDSMGYTEGSIEVRQGLDILDASDSNSEPTSRFDGENDFTTVKLEIARDVQLPRGFSVFLKGAGQLSRGPLLSSEEFNAGGNTFGRGFDPSEMTGDHGIGGTAELRYTRQFQMRGQDIGYQLYGFADAAKVFNADEGQPDEDDLASVGGGVRLDLPLDIQLGGEVAVPLQDLKRNNDNEVLFLFNIVKRF